MTLTFMSAAFQISLIATVFAFGLQAQKAEDVRFLLEQTRLLVTSLLAMFLVTPALALAIAVTFPIPITLQVAMVALSLSMITPLLPQKELAAGGHRSYGIGLVIVVATLAPVGIPLLVWILGRIMDRPYGVDPFEVAGVVFGLVLVPLLAGIAFGWLWPGATAAIRAVAPRVASLLTLVALAILLIVVAPIVWDILSGWTLLAAFLFNAGALAIGHVLGGPESDRSVVLALSCASRHPAIALTIATANYPGRNFAAGVILVLLVNAIACPLYLKWQRQRAAGVAEAPA